MESTHVSISTSPSTSSLSLNKPILRAYLSKKGHLVKNWKLRLFVLKYGSNAMEYFVDESKESSHQPQGRIPLYNCKVNEYLYTKHSNSSSGSGSGSGSREYCFIIETFEGKSWIVSASSKQQQIQWIESIREAASQAEECDEVKISKHKSIEKALQQESKAKSKIPILKLLLLGTGESGKSTIVKQMKIMHHKGFSQEEKEFYRQLVHRNLLDGVSILCRVIISTDGNKEVHPETRNSINQFMAWYVVYEAKRPVTLTIKLQGSTINSASSPSLIGNSASSNISPVNTPPQSPPISPPISPPQSPRISLSQIPTLLEDNLNISDKPSSSSTSSSSSSSETPTLDNSGTSTPKLTHSRSNSGNNNNILYNVEENGIPPAIITYITNIWSDPIVQTDVIIKAQQFHIHESTQYFLNEAKRITKSGYSPNALDILKSRSTTNGVQETDFKLGEVVFRIVDVAGQRGERKKWMSFFDDITAIIFVAAINEYDQVLVEDNTTNRLQESLNLFEQVCNDPTFPKSSIILFLNKIDLFREKLKRSSIQTCFPDYRDDQTYEKTSNYIKNNFLSKKRGSSSGEHSKHIYYHFTCATDTKSFEAVFNSVQDIIMSKILEQYQ